MAGLAGRMMDSTKDFLSSHRLQRFMPFMGNLQAHTPSYYKVGEQFLKMFIELGGDWSRTTASSTSVAAPEGWQSLSRDT